MLAFYDTRERAGRRARTTQMGPEVMDLKIMHPAEVAGGMADNTVPGGKLAGPTTTPIPATLVLLVVMAAAVAPGVVGAMAVVAAALAT